MFVCVCVLINNKNNCFFSTVGGSANFRGGDQHGYCNYTTGTDPGSARTLTTSVEISSPELTQDQPETLTTASTEISSTELTQDQIEP